MSDKVVHYRGTCVCVVRLPSDWVREPAEGPQYENDARDRIWRAMQAEVAAKLGVERREVEVSVIRLGSFVTREPQPERPWPPLRQTQASPRAHAAPAAPGRAKRACGASRRGS